MSIRTLAGVLLAVAAAAQSPSIQEQIASRLSADALKADVSFLASDALQGRGTPSAGLEIAGEYIAAQFRRAGLEPAGDDGYFQNAPFVILTPNLNGLQFTLEIGGNFVSAAESSIALTEVVGAELRDAAALMVSMAEAEGLAPEQVRGKILILDVPEGPPPRSVSTLAAKLEPAVVILLRNSGRTGPVTPRLREVAAQPAVPVLTVWDEGIRNALAGQSGPLNATFSVHIPAPTITPVKLRNVIGVLRGSDPQLADTYLMVTAHYDHLGTRGTGEGDHIFNGANDDASGTASVIEIANALAALPTRPKRSIVFMALFGEELGLVGSRYYARHPAFSLAKTVADLNLEQLGRTDDATGPRVGILNVTGFDYTSLTPILQKAGEDFGIQVLKDEKASDAFFARSDNQAFADAGVPSHTLSVGYEFPDYHRAGDEWPKLDYENMAKVNRTVALAIFRVADSVEVPRWNTENPKTERYVKARGQ